jgi:hypothetical protein
MSPEGTNSIFRSTVTETTAKGNIVNINIKMINGILVMLKAVPLCTFSHSLPEDIPPKDPTDPK